jgi:hypothetical protein
MTPLPSMSRAAQPIALSSQPAPCGLPAVIVIVPGCVSGSGSDVIATLARITPPSAWLNCATVSRTAWSWTSRSVVEANTVTREPGAQPDIWSAANAPARTLPPRSTTSEPAKCAARSEPVSKQSASITLRRSIARTTVALGALSPAGPRVRRRR